MWTNCKPLIHLTVWNLLALLTEITQNLHTAANTSNIKMGIMFKLVRHELCVLPQLLTQLIFLMCNLHSIKSFKRSSTLFCNAEFSKSIIGNFKCKFIRKVFPQTNPLIYHFMYAKIQTASNKKKGVFISIFAYCNHYLITNVRY